MARSLHALAAIGIALAGTSCVHRLDRKIGPTLSTVDAEAPFLKIHMKNGDLYVLEHWTIRESDQTIHGTGNLVGPDRVTTEQGTYAVAIADVALFETNTLTTSPGVAALAVVTGLSLAVTAACIANPKSCFGSCPTFYAPDDRTHEPVLTAEGFSDAIAPALEKHDIDALYRSTGKAGQKFSLRLTNEAYETHVIKQADLLAVKRPPGGRVFSDGEQLWPATAIAAPATCRGDEGDCRARVLAVDTDERVSLTDEHDLAARETIDLTFDVADPAAYHAIVVGARQSLVTTFLIYQGLAYLGRTATTWLAQLERGNAIASAGGHALQHLVGGIEVQREVAPGDWQTVDEIYETGPIATDVHLVPLPAGTPADHLRLRLPKGGWRIDYIALATLAASGPVAPTRIAATVTRGTIGAEYAAGRTAATALPIVTLPGDAYDLAYTLPPGDGDYELFLDSRGYYLEWMRQSWIKEESPLAVLELLLDPAKALRELAPAYKKQEAQAERLFWSSRYAHP